MWRILKAEFSYTKHVLIFGYTIAVLLLIAAANVGRWDIRSYMWNTTTIYFIMMGILGGASISEKRYRYHTTLPVTPQQLGMVDWLYVTIAQLGMFLLWLVLLVFKPENRTAAVFWTMLANNALILSLITIVGIHFHLAFFGTKTYQRIEYAILLAAILTAAGLIYFGKYEEAAAFFGRHYASGFGAFAVTLSWFALSALGGEVFFRRKSYLA